MFFGDEWVLLLLVCRMGLLVAAAAAPADVFDACATFARAGEGTKLKLRLTELIATRRCDPLRPVMQQTSH